MKKSNFLLLLFLLIFIGCGTPREEIVLKATPSKSPAKLAILPINNNTNDIEAGFIFQNTIYNNFKKNNNGYNLQNIEETNELLNYSGISDGGQLIFLKPIEISEILGVDGLLYIDLDELELLTYPFYHVRTIKATFSLYNFEKLIWVKPILISVKYFGISSAFNTISGAINSDSDQLNKGLTQTGVDIAVHQGIKFATIAGMNHELAPEMIMLSNKLLTTIPKGSKSDLAYIKKSDEKIKYLREKISNDESIVTDDMHLEITEKVQVLEELIPILN